LRKQKSVPRARPASVLFVLRPHIWAQRTARSLEIAGYTTLWATSIDQAISRVARADLENLAAVTLELDGPVERSGEALALVQARCPRGAIVAVTEPLLPGEFEALFKRRILAIEKPVSARVLTYALLSLLIDPRPEAGASQSSGPPPSMLIAVSDVKSATEANPGWANLLSTYSKFHSLSPKQNTVLRMYMEGKDDKEIAYLLGCGVTTVYEHWRRITRKVMVKYKREVLADFHSYSSNAVLTSGMAEEIQPKSLEAPGLLSATLGRAREKTPAERLDPLRGVANSRTRQRPGARA